MSLLGALHAGGASLAAQQAALQVTGNNISNAGTAGYTRQVTNLASMGPSEAAPGMYTGNGAGVMSIERQVNAAVNESLRGATSDQARAQTTDSVLGRLETTFGALNDNDFSSQLTSFFNGFSTLANDPTNVGQRAVVIQNGTTIAGYLQHNAPTGEQASQAAGIQAYTVKNPVVMRASPSPQAKQVRSFNVGDLVYPTGQKNGIWWEVDDENGNRGWVTSTTISPRN